DRGRVGGYVSEGPPAFLQEGEAAFSLVAEAAEQGGAGDRVDVELFFAGLFTGTCTPAPSYPLSARTGRFLPVLLQEVRNLDHQRERDVKRDAIIEHAEPSAGWACGETSCTGGSAPSRPYPDISACLPG
ncbi:MAG: hypothetical protein ACRDN0_13585, partial [Trebonia sp.]